MQKLIYIVTGRLCLLVPWLTAALLSSEPRPELVKFCLVPSLHCLALCLLSSLLHLAPVSSSYSSLSWFFCSLFPCPLQCPTLSTSSSSSLSCQLLSFVMISSSSPMPNAVNEFFLSSFLALHFSVCFLVLSNVQRCQIPSNTHTQFHPLQPILTFLPSLSRCTKAHNKAHCKAQRHQQRASLLGGAWGNLEADVLAPGLHVEAEELFQGGRLDDLEALLAAEGRGLPVPGATDGIGQQPLHTPRTAHIDHAEGGDRGAGALCYET